MRKTSLLLLTGLGLFAALPAQAGFFLEGLAPYTVRYCDGADPALSDPRIAPPPAIYDRTSPDATWLEGQPTHESPHCNGKGGDAGAPRVLRGGEPKVPQK